MLDASVSPEVQRADCVTVSGTTALGIVLIAVSAITVAIVAAMFVWGAREDGREQRRVDALLSRRPKRR
jgi:hypothetical protein